jgi:hypothetical protein
MHGLNKKIDIKIKKEEVCMENKEQKNELTVEQKNQLKEILLTEIEVCGKEKIYYKDGKIISSQKYSGADPDMSDLSVIFYEIIYQDLLTNKKKNTKGKILADKETNGKILTAFVNPNFAGDTMNSFNTVAGKLIRSLTGFDKEFVMPQDSLTRLYIIKTSELSNSIKELFNKFYKRYHTLANFWILPKNIGRASKASKDSKDSKDTYKIFIDGEHKTDGKNETNGIDMTKSRLQKIATEKNEFLEKVQQNYKKQILENIPQDYMVKFLELVELVDELVKFKNTKNDYFKSERFKDYNAFLEAHFIESLDYWLCDNTPVGGKLNENDAVEIVSEMISAIERRAKRITNSEYAYDLYEKFKKLGLISDKAILSNCK